MLKQNNLFGALDNEPPKFKYKGYVRELGKLINDLNWIEKHKRLQKIYLWYKAYKKANPKNSIKTSFKLAKWSYENSLKGINIFVPYIPETPVPNIIPYVPESVKKPITIMDTIISRPLIFYADKGKGIEKLN